MADQVWISEKEAMEIMKRSAWGRLLEPNVTEKLSIFELVSMGHKTNIVHGLSDTKKALLKFDLYIQKTLGNFSEINPKSYNKKENKYDEVAIRKFVTKAMDAELAKEFGAPPSIIVD